MATVSQIRQFLEDMEADGHGNKEVMLAYNGNDHWRTPLAASISDEEMGLTKVTWSEYHCCNKQITDKSSERDKENAFEVVFLNAEHIY